jgi:hypothetical protein
MTSTAALARPHAPLAQARHPYIRPAHQPGRSASVAVRSGHVRHRRSAVRRSRHPHQIPTIAVFVSLFCSFLAALVLTGQAVAAAVLSLFG